MEKGQGKGTDTLQTENGFTRKEYIKREAALSFPLAAYEDTGLEPETCKDIKSLCDDYVDAGLDASFILACIAAARAGISSKRMTEISKAETDNRLIILPCKIGTDCWRVNFNRRRHPIEQIRFDVTSYNAFGKTVFLTREEAEAALKGEGKDV